MTTKERRINRRVDAAFKINYIHEGDYLISFSKDISIEGMFIYTEKPLPVGSPTQVSFSMDGVDEPITVKAKVVWANMHGGKKDKGIGVKFLNPPAKVKQAVLHFVNRVAIIDKM